MLVGEGWRDNIEALVRDRIRGLIEEILEEELCEALGRERYARRISEPGAAVDISQRLGEEVRVSAALVKGHRNGRREREVMGTFGKVTIAVPRARLEREDGTTIEWKTKTLPAYRRRTKEVEALIAGSYLPGTNTRRRRACAGVGIPPGWRQQGHGEPSLAQDQDGLGGLEQARSSFAGYRSIDFGRDGCARAP